MDGNRSIRRFVFLVSALAFVAASYAHGSVARVHAAQSECSSPNHSQLQDLQTTPLYTQTTDIRIARRGWLDRKIRKTKRLIKKITWKFKKYRKQIKRSLRRYKNKVARNVGKGFRQAKRTIRIARRHVKRKYRRVKLFIRRSHRKVRMFIRGKAL